MANLDTLDITAADLMRHLNPTLDPNGIQIGAIFALTEVDAAGARISANVLTVTLPGVHIGMNQLEGYVLIINNDYNGTFTILANSPSNDNGVLHIQVQEILPTVVPAAEWTVSCKQLRVDYEETYAEKMILRAVREMKMFLRPDYMNMISQISGQNLWSNEQINTGSLAITLPFYKASNVRIWKGLVFGYEHRLDDAVELTLNTDFTVTHNDELKLSIVTLAEQPKDETRLAIDYSHTLDPVPETLKELALDFAKIIVLQSSPNIRSGMTYEQTQLMRTDLENRMQKGIYEFDKLAFYQETRRRQVSIHTDIKIRRG